MAEREVYLTLSVSPSESNHINLWVSGNECHCKDRGTPICSLSSSAPEISVMIFVCDRFGNRARDEATWLAKEIKNLQVSVVIKLMTHGLYLPFFRTDGGRWLGTLSACLWVSRIIEKWASVYLDPNSDIIMSDHLSSVQCSSEELQSITKKKKSPRQDLMDSDGTRQKFWDAFWTVYWGRVWYIQSTF